MSSKQSGLFKVLPKLQKKLFDSQKLENSYTISLVLEILSGVQIHPFLLFAIGEVCALRFVHTALLFWLRFQVLEGQDLI